MLGQVFRPRSSRGFIRPLDAVEEHERSCDELLSYLLADLWCDATDPEEMALPAASIFKVLHCPLHKLQLVWREEVAAASCAGAAIVAWWRKLRRPPEDFKDLHKIG